MSLQAFIQHGQPGQPMQTESVPLKESALAWQERGQTWTASGYGEKIATRYLVKVGGHWRRVYSHQYRHGPETLFIGRNLDTGTRVTMAPATVAPPAPLSLDLAERATILAALNHYKASGYGNPDLRPLRIHEIAAGDDWTSLDDDGIDALHRRVASAA